LLEPVPGDFNVVFGVGHAAAALGIGRSKQV
jgi:hypothetical protein